MKREGNHLQLVETSGTVVPFPTNASAQQAEVVYLRSVLKCNTIDLAEHRRKLVEMKRDLERLRRLALRVVPNENQGSDPGTKS